jgi:hypothetical protein
MKKSLWFTCMVLLLASPATSRAGVIINMEQVGPNVIATGGGSIDITDLTIAGTLSNPAFVFAGFPFGSYVSVGGHEIVPQDAYRSITGPASFGSGGQHFATSGSGDVFGVIADSQLNLPPGYISGSPLVATSTWSGESFSSLGLTPGSYTWTWGTGAHADSFTLNIGVAPVPEPTTLTMALFAGLAGIGARLWSRRGAVRG